MCEAISGPFRQNVPVPFSDRLIVNPRTMAVGGDSVIVDSVVATVKHGFASMDARV